MLGTVFALAAQGSTVYAGGIFSSVGGLNRKGIAAIEAASGNVTPWNPQLVGEVKALAVRGSRIYVGGNFTSIDGQSRRGLVALDSTTGAALPAAAPDTSGGVATLVATDNQVYVGGFFDSIDGASRKSIAAFDTASGAVTTFHPDLNGGVNALAFDTGTLYLGGEFTSVDTQPQHYLSGISVATAATTQPATNITATSATLNGLVNANGADTTISFELTTRSGDYSAARVLAATPALASSIMPVTVSAVAGGLTPGTTYYYRVIAITGSGAIAGVEQELKALAVTYIPIIRR